MSFNIINKSTLPKRPKTVDSNVIANLQQGTQAGLVLNETTLTVSEANAPGEAVAPKTNALRVLSPVFLPTLGGWYGETAASQSLSKLYNSVVGSAYDSTSFNRADLGKHLILSESFILAVDMIDRYLDSFACTEFGNYGAECIIAGQLFTKANTDFMNLQAVRNLFVPLIAKLLIPSHIPWLNRHRALVRHVYVDDIHKKTCFITPVPYFLYDTLMATFNVSSSKSYYADGTNASYNVLTFAQSMLAKLTTYVDSAFLADISPYLWRAMCQSNGPHIDTPITIAERHDSVPLLNLDVIFDYNVIQMVRNATYVGGFLNEHGNVSLPADMEIEEDNNGKLVQGRVTVASGVVVRNLVIKPLAIIYSAGTTPATTLLPDDVNAYVLTHDDNNKFLKFIYPGNMDNKYVNLEDYPSSDEAIYYTMNATANISAVNNSYKFELMGVANCGDTLFIHLLFTYNASPQYPNLYSVKKFLPVKFYNMNNLTTQVRYAKGVIANDGSAVLNSMEDILYLAESLVCCPPISCVYSLQDESLECKVCYVDKDNLVAISRRALIRAHEYIMFSAFDLVSDQQFDSGNSGDSRISRKKKRNKKPKSNKDKGKDSDQRSSDSKSD